MILRDCSKQCWDNLSSRCATQACGLYRNQVQALSRADVVGSGAPGAERTWATGCSKSFHSACTSSCLVGSRVASCLRSDFGTRIPRPGLPEPRFAKCGDCLPEGRFFMLHESWKDWGHFTAASRGSIASAPGTLCLASFEAMVDAQAAMGDPAQGSRTRVRRKRKICEDNDLHLLQHGVTKKRAVELHKHMS